MGDGDGVSAGGSAGALGTAKAGPGLTPVGELARLFCGLATDCENVLVGVVGVLAGVVIPGGVGPPVDDPDGEVGGVMQVGIDGFGVPLFWPGGTVPP